jgi:hypothetical protein
VKGIGDFLDKWIPFHIDRALRDHAIPQAFADQALRIAKEHKQEIATAATDCIFLGRPMHLFPFHTDINPVYLVASIFPCMEASAIRWLQNHYSQPPFGYMNLVTEVFNNWPSQTLNYLFNPILCMDLQVGNVVLHTGMIHFGEGLRTRKDFCILPVQLLTDEERRNCAV